MLVLTDFDHLQLAGNKIACGSVLLKFNFDNDGVRGITLDSQLESRA